MKKIIFKIRLIAVKAMLKTSLYLNWPWLGALALWLAANKVNQGKGRYEYTVLCLGRTIFSDDVAAMAGSGRRVKYVSVHRSYFCQIFNYLAGDWEKEKLSEENYHVNNFCQAGKERYYLYLKKLFPYWHKLLRFNAVFSGNFVYVEHQELMRVCEENKVPFVVLFKEGIAATASGAYDKWLDMCRGCVFIGAKVLFYGDKVRKSLLSINLPGLTEAKSEVVGAPRLDAYFSDLDLKNRQLKKQIILFSFYSENFYNLTGDLETIKQARKRCDDFHVWFMNFAKRYKDYTVIIKTKFPKHYLSYVKNIYEKVFQDEENRPANLAIINLGNSAQLIKDSIAVAGFYSTTLTEAIVAGKISLSPFFGDIITDKPWDYFAMYPELINYVKSESDLEEYVMNYEKYLAYSQERREKFLRQLIHIPDGQASFRAESAIIEAVEEYRKN